MMENPLDKTATDTIEYLEARLRRIEFAVSGHDEVSTDVPRTSAAARMGDLERALDRLTSNSRVLQELLKLRESTLFLVGFH